MTETPASKTKIMTPVVWVLITLTIILLVSAALTTAPIMIYLIWAATVVGMTLILLLISKAPKWK